MYYPYCKKCTAIKSNEYRATLTPEQQEAYKVTNERSRQRRKKADPEGYKKQSKRNFDNWLAKGNNKANWNRKNRAAMKARYWAEKKVKVEEEKKRKLKPDRRIRNTDKINRL